MRSIPVVVLLSLACYRPPPPAAPTFETFVAYDKCPRRAQYARRDFTDRHGVRYLDSTLLRDSVVVVTPACLIQTRRPD